MYFTALLETQGKSLMNYLRIHSGSKMHCFCLHDFLEVLQFSPPVQTKFRSMRVRWIAQGNIFKCLQSKVQNLNIPNSVYSDIWKREAATLLIWEAEIREYLAFFPTIFAQNMISKIVSSYLFWLTDW